MNENILGQGFSPFQGGDDNGVTGKVGRDGGPLYALDPLIIETRKCMIHLTMTCFPNKMNFVKKNVSKQST